ncbi:cytochrome b561 and DOMON domain-containing protein At3g25290-like [Prosopis cineraria]|uniref:cytochrome b561 and DOMON domain-containing protein At3g25290-like n=1 Tax=Prosopis cineraria TaxID=364024 RepID=UPI00240FF93E|nr:cytochrome b561 and DOMON domain-containing protein At3g25290-like [Prosopis cineraria]
MSLPRSITIPLFLGLSLLVSLPSPVTSLTCTSQKFSDNKVYSNCVDLPVLNSYLHWTLDSSNSSLSIAFVAAPAKPGGWVSWAINPTGTGMAGAQALVAFENEGVVMAKTYNISSYSSVVPGKLSFDVWDLKAEKLSGGAMMSILAKVKLPENAETVNQVWQVGPSVTDGELDSHEFAPANLDSKGVLNLKSGHSSSISGGADSRTQQKNIHGVLNAVSWGFLFPLGVIIARYMRVFPSLDPTWFYLHVFCQVSGYAIGVSGWAIGLKLGSESHGIHHSGHRNIGIALFCLATLQVFALFLRPKKEHKYRTWWNMYHHGIGYITIILGIINIFGGFNILSPHRRWKIAYVAAIAALAVIALLLEVITWIVFFTRKRRNNNA